MSRNGPFGQARAPQRRGPAEHDPYAAGGGQPAQWPPQQQGGYPEPPYNNGGQPAYNGAQPGHNGSQQGYPPQQGQQAYHFPQEPDPQYGHPQQAQGQMPGYGQAPYQPQPAPQWAPQQDPRNYDLGSYMPTGTQGFAPAEPAHFQHPQEPAPFTAPQQGYAETDADYDDALADGEDEPRSGRRWLVIVAALVGAIGLGGGLAYTYKMLFTSSSSRPPIVKAIDFPNKVKPVTAGKENAQVDKKLFTRLGEDGPEARATAGSEQDAQEERAAEGPVGGPRPVRIIPISPGGQGQVNTTGSVTNTKPGGVTIPGLKIDTSMGGPRAPSQQQQQQAVQPSPQGRSIALQQEPVAEPVAPQKKVAIVVPNTPAAKIPVPKKEPAGGAVANAASLGYVAVLSSQRSRMDAMKAYASIDQKYRDMLASSTFDVQEADLGEKGIWYRAVVGPPRSFDGARKICEELKAAGYPACWPAKY